MRLILNIVFSARVPSRQWQRRLAFGLWAVFLGLALASELLHAGESVPQELMHRHFPRSQIEQRTVYVTNELRDQLVREIGAQPSARRYAFYLARAGGRTLGCGVLDTHIVRTKQQSLFIILDASGDVLQIEQLAFHEPGEYRAPLRWLALLRGKRVSSPLRPGVDLPAITGATMTAASVARSVKTILRLNDFCVPMREK